MRSKSISVLLTVLFLMNFTFAQSGKNSSTVVGIYLNTVTHDKKGNMWVGGSMYLSQGFLLRVNSKGVNVVTPPKIEGIQNICFIDLENAVMIADYKKI